MVIWGNPGAPARDLTESGETEVLANTPTSTCEENR